MKKKPPPKSAAEVYRLLAGDIAAQPDCVWFICNSLEELSKWESPLMVFFEDLYRQEGIKNHMTCGGGWWPMCQNEPRILALLLAAEICERGGL